jgi:flagellin
VQTAEGGMQEVSAMLQRMRELATQGNNDSLNDTQRGYIGTEIVALGAEIDKVSSRTTFNGQSLLDGSMTNGTFQVGVETTDTVDISSLMQDVSTSTGLTALGTAITNLDDSSTKLAALGTAVDTAINTVAGYRSSLGAMNNRLDHNIANLQAQTQALTASRSRITDTDYAAETATLSKTQVLSQAATAMLSQANQMPSSVLSLLK